MTLDELLGMTSGVFLPWLVLAEATVGVPHAELWAILAGGALGWTFKGANP